MKEKSLLEKEIAEISEELSHVNGNFKLESLSKKQKLRNEYERTIRETEGAYVKILESSQTLLHVLKRECINLNKKYFN